MIIKQLIPPIITKLGEAILSVFNDMVEDPLNELRGHLTAPILRSWIIKNQTPMSAGCIVYYDATDKKVTAFIVDKDREPIFTQDGKRIIVVFKASSLDNELTVTFTENKTLFIPIEHK